MPDLPTGPVKKILEQVRRARQNHLAPETIDSPQQQYLSFRLNEEWYGLSVFQLVELYSQAGQLDEAKLEYANVVRLLNEVAESFDEQFAGGFSPTLLVDTCLSRLRILNSEQ